MKDLKRMRLLCGLRQIDLSMGTGITLHKISGAEQGRTCLSATEENVLRNFLSARWRSIEVLESSPASSDGVLNVTVLQREMSA